MSTYAVFDNCSIIYAKKILLRTDISISAQLKRRSTARMERRSRPFQIREIEHVIPKSRGGTEWVSNLAIACEACNLHQGVRTAQEFGFPGIHQRGSLASGFPAVP